MGEAGSVDDPVAAPAPLSRRQRAWPWLRRGYAACVVVVLAVLLWRVPESLRTVAEQVTPAGAMAFVLGWLSMVLCLGALWSQALRLLGGARLPLRVLIAAQGAAWAGRYLPGKFGLLAGKLALAERPGLGVRRIGASVLFEQIAFIAAGALVAVLCLDPVQVLARYGLAAPVGSLAIRGVGLLAATLVLYLAAHLARRATDPGQRGGRWSLVLLGGGYVLPHLLCGAGLYALQATSTAFGTADFLLAAGALALANVAGVLAVFAPAGLGVREAVLAASLPLDGGLATGIALAATIRVLCTLGDLLVVGLGLACALPRGQSRPRPAPSP
jgi:hypothetical protein